MRGYHQSSLRKIYREKDYFACFFNFILTVLLKIRFETLLVEIVEKEFVKDEFGNTFGKTGNK